MIYKWGYDRSKRLELAQREADVALRLAPGLPKAPSRRALLPRCAVSSTSG